MAAPPLRKLLAVLALVVAVPACGDDEPKLDHLFLRVTSEAPSQGGGITALRVLFARGDQRYPSDLADPAFNLGLALVGDPAERSVLVAVRYDGATFASADVQLQVIGHAGAAPVAVFEGPIDLTAKAIVDIRLRALPAGCDADGDGFLDCGTAGCCPFGEGDFADCEPDHASANPWGTRPECKACDDLVDDDCSGPVAPCVDADGDGIADCLEVDCGLGDPTVGPGLPELCDGKDNDCDGQTDEDFKAGAANTVTLGGAIFAGDDGKFLGDACGAGACSGGTVVCDASDPTRRSLTCETPEEPTAEVCDDVDNDCDGETDEDFAPGGGVTYDGGPFAEDADKGLGEACGTGACDGGVVVCDATGAGLTCTTAGEAEVEACDGADNDCDGETDEDFGADGDLVYDGGPYAADAGKVLGDPCGVGVCAGGTVVCTASGDALTCSTLGQITGESCDDLDNDCNGVVDDPFLAGGAVSLVSPRFAADAGKHKGEACGAGACADGTVTCSPGEDTLICSTDALATAEVCDDVDNDCDGDTDEGFVYTGAPFPGDREKVKGDSCGVGPCAGGTVVCGGEAALTCTTVVTHATAERCDGVDNDCDGATDEIFSDGTVTLSGAAFADDDGKGLGDACGTGACGAGSVACDTTDPARQTLVCVTPFQASAERCDGFDNDCDGATDEDFKAGGSVTLTGAAFAPDNGKVLDDACGTGACGAGAVACDASDPSGMSLRCATPFPPTAELCDDVDNDCDGATDEDFKAGGTVTYGGPWPDETGRVLGASCGTGPCAGGTVVCTSSGEALTCSTLGNASTDVCDGADNDCDGVADQDFKAGGTVTYDGGPWAEDPGTVLGQACGAGPCAGGSVVCDGPTALTCSTLGLATAEICDGEDNDCSGAADVTAEGDDACAGCEPYDVCDDCVDNECDGDVDGAESGEPCVERRIIGIWTPGEPLPAGYAVPLTFDHTRYVTRGQADASGEDVQLFWYNDATARFEEIDLVLDPTSSWDTAATTIWFALAAPVPAGVVNTDYYLYLGTRDPATRRDPRAVFHYADFFDRADADALGEGWVETEQSATGITLTDGRLFAQTVNDAVHNPSAYVDFPPISGGVWHWRYGFDWTRNGEGTYRVMMQLGHGASMTAPTGDEAAYPNAGVGVSLAWGGGATAGFGAHNTLGWELAGVITSLGTITGANDIDVRVDLGATTPSYSLNVGDPLVAQASVPFSTAQSTLDRIRFVIDRVSPTVTGRAFPYVLVRPGVANPANEPVAFLGVKEPVACPLVDTNLLARYYLDDAVDDPLGVGATVLKDAAPTPAPLTRTVDASGSPAFVLIGDQWALYFDLAATTARALIAGSASKIWAGVDGRLAVTFELVVEDYRGGDSYLFSFERNDGRRFGLATAAGGTQLELYRVNTLVGRWDVALGTGERTVLHLVWDTAQATPANRRRLYVDGALAPLASGSTAPGQNDTVNLGTTSGGHTFTLGNRRASDNAMRGYYYYAAIYQRAMDAAEVLTNYRVLMRDADRNPPPD